MQEHIFCVGEVGSWVEVSEVLLLRLVPEEGK